MVKIIIVHLPEDANDFEEIHIMNLSNWPAIPKVEEIISLEENSYKVIRVIHKIQNESPFIEIGVMLTFL